MSVAFETIVSEVKVFVEGHGRLPGKEEDNGLWIICQRRKHSQLSEVRIQLLESIPHWTWDPSGDAFATAVSEVKAFVEEHGRLPGKEENRGLWLINQRIKHRKNALPAERVQLIEAIPHWTWDPSGDAFATAISEVTAFAEVHGHLPSTSDNHGRWVNNQRTTYKKRKLSEDRIHALEAIPYWTWSSLRVGC